MSARLIRNFTHLLELFFEANDHLGFSNIINDSIDPALMNIVF